MRSDANIDKDDFNIEGATHAGKNWLFLNRGNGARRRNVIFTVQGNNLMEDFRISFKEIDIPLDNGMPFGFSDATFVGNTLFFIATSEEGKSTYNDGKVGGTLFGTINMEKMEIGFTQIISRTQKFEGITLYRTETDKISFLLCEDDDGTTDTTIIYQLDLATTSLH